MKSKKLQKYQNSGSTGYSWSQGQTNGNALVPATRPGELKETQKDINKRQEQINKLANDVLKSKSLEDLTDEDYSIIEQSTIPKKDNITRDYRILKANRAQQQDNAWTAEGIANSTAALGDKLSLQRLPGIGQYIPDVLDVTKGLGDMAAGLGAIPDNLNKGQYGQASLNLGLPLLIGALAGLGTTTRGQFLNNLVNPMVGTGDILNNLGNKYLPNAYKLNPLAFKTNPNNFYRQIDNETFQEGLESGLIRGKQNIDMTRGENIININKSFGDDAYYNKGRLYYKNNKDLPYLFEANLPEEKFIPKVNGRTRKYTTENTSVRVSKKPLPINDPNITTYKKDWLKGYKPIEVPKSNFKSEIDWSKWNKEIPKNKALMQEYNIIEQQTKADGTWMKNPDGSKFQGTPEQFVQQNSQNFKKAFGNSKLVNPDGSPTIQYHGSAKKFDTFDESKFQLGDSGYSGRGIYTTPDKNKASSYSLSSKSIHKDGNHEPTVYELYGQGNNPISAEDLINQKKEYDLFNFHRQKDWRGDVPLEEQMLDYDVAIRNQTRGIERVSPWNQADELVFPTNKQLKSAIGNNGMFDMTNPNIYKSLLPIILGAAGLSQQNEEQDTQKYQSGGAIMKTQKKKGLQKYQEGSLSAVPANDIDNFFGDVPYIFGSPWAVNNKIIDRAKALMDEDKFKNLNNIISTPLKHMHSNYGSPILKDVSTADLFGSNRAYYTPHDNTAYIRPGNIQDYIAELSHAFQKKHDPLNFGDSLLKDNKLADKEFATGKHKTWKDAYDAVLYSTPGTMEYQAHSEIEPNFLNELKSYVDRGILANHTTPSIGSKDIKPFKEVLVESYAPNKNDEAYKNFYKNNKINSFDDLLKLPEEDLSKLYDTLSSLDKDNKYIIDRQYISDVKKEGRRYDPKRVMMFNYEDELYNLLNRVLADSKPDEKQHTNNYQSGGAIMKTQKKKGLQKYQDSGYAKNPYQDPFASIFSNAFGGGFLASNNSNPFLNIQDSILGQPLSTSVENQGNFLGGLPIFQQLNKPLGSWDQESKGIEKSLLDADIKKYGAQDFASSADAWAKESGQKFSEPSKMFKAYQKSIQDRAGQQYDSTVAAQKQWNTTGKPLAANMFALDELNKMTEKSYNQGLKFDAQDLTKGAKGQEFRGFFAKDGGAISALYRSMGADAGLPMQRMQQGGQINNLLSSIGVSQVQQDNSTTDRLTNLNPTDKLDYFKVLSSYVKQNGLDALKAHPVEFQFFTRTAEEVVQSSTEPTQTPKPTEKEPPVDGGTLPEVEIKEKRKQEDKEETTTPERPKRPDFSSKVGVTNAAQSFEAMLEYLAASSDPNTQMSKDDYYNVLMQVEEEKRRQNPNSNIYTPTRRPYSPSSSGQSDLIRSIGRGSVNAFQNSGNTGYSWSQGQTKGKEIVPASKSVSATTQSKETQKDINKQQEDINKLAKSILGSKDINDFTDEDINILSQSTVPNVKETLRDYRINRANKAQENQVGIIPTAEEFKNNTAALGDKLSLQRLPGVGQYIPDALDATGGIGQMAAGLGEIPSNLQQGQYGQAALNLGLPLLTGATAGGVGTKGFLNNLVNPIADIDVSKLKGLFNKKKSNIPTSLTDFYGEDFKPEWVDIGDGYKVSKHQGHYQGRPVMLVKDKNDNLQPFYMRTGRGGPDMGWASSGNWVPYNGHSYAPAGTVLRDRDIHGWFIKPEGRGTLDSSWEETSRFLGDKLGTGDVGRKRLMNEFNDFTPIQSDYPPRIINDIYRQYGFDLDALKDSHPGKIIYQSGGPINQLQQMMGYKDNSPYRSLPFQTINSNSITMDGVSQPLLAIADNGERRIMQPNSGLHNFQGANSVLEVPMAQNGMATRQDSIDVTNSAKAVNTYFKNRGYRDMGKGVFLPSKGEFLNIMSQNKELLRQMMADGEYPITNRSANRILSDTEDKSFKMSDYYQEIDKNKFKQRELAAGRLDLRSPFPLYDKRIEPQFRQDYYNMTEFDSMKGDMVEMYQYDPLATTPVDMLTPLELIARKQKYPNSFGSPKTSAPKKSSRMESIKKRSDSPIIEPRQPRPSINISQIDTIDPRALSLPQRYVESPEIEDPNFTSGEMIKPYEGVPNLNIVFKERKSDGQLIPVFIENQAGERVPYNSQLNRNFQYRKKEQGGKITSPINLSKNINPFRLSPINSFGLGGLIRDGVPSRPKSEVGFSRQPISGATTKGPMGPKATDIPSYNGGVRKLMDMPENEYIATENLIPIQTEKREMIVHPTGDLTKVMATKRHHQMDEDEVTDVAPEGAYILSSFGKVRINKDEAEQVITETGVKPYRIGNSQETPTEKTLGSMMNKKSMAPADVAKMVDRYFPVNSTNNPFELAANNENKTHRVPYLEGLIQLSELDKLRKGIDSGMESQQQENEDEMTEAFKNGGSTWGGLPMREMFLPKAQAGLAIGLGTSLLQGIFGAIGANAQKKDAQRAYQDVLGISNKSAADQKQNIGMGSLAGILGTLNQDPTVTANYTDPTYLRQMQVRTPASTLEAVSNRAYANMPNYMQTSPSWGSGLAAQQAAYSAALKGANDSRLAIGEADRGAYNNWLGLMQTNLAQNDASRIAAINATRLNRNQIVGNVGDKTQGMFDSFAGIEANRANTASAARLGQAAANQQAIRAFTQASQGAIGSAGATAYDYFNKPNTTPTTNPGAGYGSGVGPNTGGVTWQTNQQTPPCLNGIRTIVSANGQVDYIPCK